MKKQQGFVNIIVILVVLGVIASAGYFVFVKQPSISSSQKQPETTTNVTSSEPANNTGEVTTKKEPQKTPAPLPTIDIKAELINALNKNDYLKIESFMSAKVQFTIESSNCCGSINRSDAIEQIKRAMSGGAKLDFSQEQEKVKQVKQNLAQQGYTNSCTDVVVGIGIIGNTSAITFCLSQGKVIAVRLASKITVVSPNNAEVLVRGSTYIIKWNNPERIGPIDIFLVKGGKIQTDIGFAPGAGATAPTSFTWKVDPIGADLINRTTYSLPDGSDYKIRISNQNGDIFDESDAMFSIVSQ